MKKLMIAASAALCAAVGFSSGVESQNIVGYSEIAPKGQYTGGSRYTTGGSAFLSVVNSAGYCLKDMTIVDGADEKDFIVFVQTGAAKVDNARAYYWYVGDDEDPEDPSGWCYAYKAGGHDKDDYVAQAELEAIIPVGTGFLCNFQTAGAKIVYAGQVNKGEDGSIVCSRAGRYTYIANPNPYPMSLSDITIEDGNDDKDFIIFMQTSTAKVDNARAYYWYVGDDEDPEDPSGWCYQYKAGGHDKDDYVEEEVSFKAGEGALFNSQTSTARVVFKAPTL